MAGGWSTIAVALALLWHFCKSRKSRISTFFEI